MTKQVRDWNKDKRYLEELNEWERDPDDQDLYEIASFYHERADKLQVELSEYTEAHWKAFEQEKKLREAIEEEIKMGIIWGDYNRADALEKLLASLYPKEEEAR